MRYNYKLDEVQSGETVRGYIKRKNEEVKAVRRREVKRKQRLQGGLVVLVMVAAMIMSGEKV